MALAIDPGMPEHLESFITSMDTAVTIARRICVGEHIADARIIAATAEAAA